MCTGVRVYDVETPEPFIKASSRRIGLAWPLLSKAPPKTGVILAHAHVRTYPRSQPRDIHLLPPPFVTRLAVFPP